MHRSTHALLGALAALALLVPGPSQAVIGTLDNVPAATLLVPYFEADLDDPNGPQTRLSVFNATEDATLAHVQLWTDWGTPTFGFDVYLGGRDMVEIDLRLVFAGLVPQTGPSLSGNGPFSDASVNFAGCAAGANDVSGVSLPIPDRLDATQIASLRNHHTGSPVPQLGNRCTAEDFGDGIARGYVTIDTVNQCGLASPASAGYFTGVATAQNHLVGSFTLTDRNASNYPASPMVHIEASATDPLTTTPGNHTFYGMYVAATATDQREPLGTAWQARVLSPAATEAVTELVVWRERGSVAQLTTGVNCNAMPLPFPLGQTQITLLDESEQADILNDDVVYPNPQPPPELPFPLVAQKVDAATFFPWDAGFAHLNLNSFVVGNAYGDDVLQSFVLVRLTRGGSYGASLPATMVGDPNHVQSPFVGN